MKVFHHTFAAEAILREGFRDGRGRIEDLVLEGVWISDRPLEEQDGARGDVHLVLEIPEPDIESFEVLEEGPKHYREWCVPARILNRFPVAIHEETDETILEEPDVPPLPPVSGGRP